MYKRTADCKSLATSKWTKENHNWCLNREVGQAEAGKISYVVNQLWFLVARLLQSTVYAGLPGRPVTYLMGHFLLKFIYLSIYHYKIATWRRYFASVWIIASLADPDSHSLAPRDYIFLRALFNTFVSAQGGWVWLAEGGARKLRHILTRMCEYPFLDHSFKACSFFASVFLPEQQIMTVYQWHHWTK